MTPDSLWKQSERAIGKLFGLVRSGPLGKEGPDLVTPTGEPTALAIQCKERLDLPDWLTAAVDQAVLDARPDQIPIVVLHEAGARHLDDLVIIRLGDVLELRNG